MRTHKSYIALGLIIAFGLFFELMAHADQVNEQTRITFSQPIQIPGQVLPAGTYMFRQAAPEDLNLLQIFNAEGTSLYATLETVPVERREVAVKTTITLAEAESGKTDLLVRWFYPGRVTGHEFVYSKEQEQEIAEARQEMFVGRELKPSAQAAGE